MASQFSEPDNLILLKTNEILEQISRSYTRLSLYEREIKGRPERLKLPISDNEFWDQCQKSFVKLKEEANSLDPRDLNNDIISDLEYIRFYLLLNEVEENFRKYINPLQEKVAYIKKELWMLKGGAEQLMLPDVIIKESQSHHIREQLVKIARWILEAGHYLEGGIIWSLKVELDSEECEPWTLLQTNQEPKPYHLSVVKRDSDLITKLLSGITKVAGDCVRSGVLQDDTILSEFDVLAKALQNPGVKDCKVFNTGDLADLITPSEEIKEVLDNPWFLHDESLSISLDGDDKLKPIIEPTHQELKDFSDRILELEISSRVLGIRPKWLMSKKGKEEHESKKVLLESMKEEYRNMLELYNSQIENKKSQPSKKGLEKEEKEGRRRKKGGFDLPLGDSKSPEPKKKVNNWMSRLDEDDFRTPPSGTHGDQKSRGGRSKGDSGKKEKMRKRSEPSDPDDSSSSDDDSSGSEDDDDSNSDDSGDDSKKSRKKKKSKEKAKKKKKKKKKKRGSRDRSKSETESEDESIVSVSTLRTEDTFQTAYYKVTKFLKSLQSDLKNDRAGPYQLKEYVQETKDMLTTLNKMDGSRALSKLEDKLQKMKKRLAKEIDSKHRQMEQRRNLPKAVIPIFDTDHPESFLDFEYNMTNILVYDNEHLNISTLTSAIIGSQRQKVLNSIRHKTSIEDIWSILRRKFGSIDVSQASLLKKLRLMNPRPRTDEEEASNLQMILEYIDLAKRHKRVKQFITAPFIWEMANFLKYSHRSHIIETKISKPKEFEEYLRVISEANDLTIRTRKIDDRKPPGTGERVEGSGRGGFSRLGHRGGQRGGRQAGGRGDHRTENSGTPGGPHLSNQNSTRFEKKPLCAICKQEHPTHTCEQLKHFSVEDLKKRNICTKCLKRSNTQIHTNHGCNPRTNHFVCRTHNIHHLICRCPKTTQNKTQVLTSTKKGDFFQRQILFNAEKVHIELEDGNVVPVLLQYDSWASDSSINAKLAGGLKGLQHEGNLLIQQFATVVEQPDTYTGLVKLKEMDEELRCMVSQQEPQNVHSKVVDVPVIWREEHGLSDQFVSSGGEVMLVLGMDNYKLFPRFIDGQKDLVLSRSVITNNIIVGGKAQKHQPDSRPTLGGGGYISSSSSPGWVGSRNNSTIVTTVEENQKKSLKEDEKQRSTQCRTVTCGDPDTDTLLKFLSSTEIPNPLKRCIKCRSCDQCKKSYLPDQENSILLLYVSHGTCPASRHNCTCKLNSWTRGKVATPS